MGRRNIESALQDSIERSAFDDDSYDFAMALVDELDKAGGFYRLESNRMRSIITGLAKEFKFPIAGSGTSRMAIENSKNTVLKIPHRRTGMVDNTYEWLISELVDDGTISKRAGDRLALTTSSIDNEDGMIIEQEWIDCLCNIGKSGSRAGREGVRWLLQNMDEYEDMIADLEEDFLLVDISIKRPFNMGLKNRRLMVLDYGLFLPKIDLPNLIFSTGAEYESKSGKIYCKCGKEMLYEIPRVDNRDIERLIDEITGPEADQGNTTVKSEVYRCECNLSLPTRRMYEEMMIALSKDKR